MRKAATILILVLPFVLAGCKARRGDPESAATAEESSPAPADSDGAATAGPKAAPPLARRTDGACPECDGLGICGFCGDERPCLAGDGTGRCGLCGGDGRTRDGVCPACDGDGVCRDCGGDGILSRARGEIGPGAAPIPGQCPTCEYGTGLCPACGGSGERPDGGRCAFCDGEKWCPTCRGAGTDPFCAGSGVCPSCRGHGRVVDGRPDAAWPPMRLLTTDGEVIVGRLLDRPSATIAIERESSGRPVREALPAKSVEPLSRIVALRRYAAADEAADHAELAEIALAAGDDLLFLARAELRAAAALAPAPAALASRIRAAEARTRARIVADARRALEREKDARTAWRLFALAENAFGGGAAEDVRAERVRAAAIVASEDAGLAEDLRERKRAAEEQRFLRARRRAAEWRARAETLLGTTDASVVDLERALFAARRAVVEVRAAMARAPGGTDLAPARAEAEAARSVAARTVVAVAGRLLGAGLLERARALAALALAIRPDDEGAALFAAVVDEAIARRAAAPEGGR